MKKNLFIVIILVTTLWNCNQNGIIISEPTNEELIEIIPEANKITTELLSSLKGELKKAIQEGGFENAIGVCNLKAMPITQTIEKVSKENIQIKRTTFKYRNPDNAPDEIEQLALEHFENLIEKNESLPEYYMQKVTKEEVVEYYYYKPLTIENVCLGCHGIPENMDTRLLSQLSQLYPEDKAMGYKEGDFRGLISVIIPE